TASSPNGSVDRLAAAPSGVRADGWAMDPNTDAPLNVRITVDGVAAATESASTARPDLPAHFPHHGPNHGFSIFAPMTAGTHRVCVGAFNVGPGANRAVVCAMITRSDSPLGHLDRVGDTGGGRRATGWALDMNTGNPISVDVQVATAGGVQHVSTTANDS